MDEKSKLRELWELFWTFAKMGVMTFGGGMAMLPILQREVVDAKHWATEEELDRAYAALRAGDLTEYLAAYRRRCVNLGKTVRLIPFGGGERETAQAVDIDEEFSLVVRGADGGERTVRSGEVSVRGLWGYTE